MTAPSPCIACDASSVGKILDLGPRPPSNRYLRPGETVGDCHPLVLGHCQGCGHLQLIAPMPAALVRSRFPWISYNEPEAHLDAVVSEVMQVLRLPETARLAGLTYKDDTTLRRFADHGCRYGYRPEPRLVFGTHDCAGLESVQSTLTKARCEELAKQFGAADLVVFRHVLEHTLAPAQVLAALAKLLASGGHILFEVPDCRKFLRHQDYSFVWEDHISYFSEISLAGFIRRHGWEVVWSKAYPYALEDSVVLLARPASGEPPPSPTDPELAPDAMRAFGDGYAGVRGLVAAKLTAAHGAGKRIALFGAGHMAARFVSIYGLADLIAVAIDDNPDKQGLFLPGSGIPIVGSAALADIDLCLLSVSPSSEAKLVEAHGAFGACGGIFASIYAGSPLWLASRLP